MDRPAGDLQKRRGGGNNARSVQNNKATNTSFDQCGEQTGRDQHSSRETYDKSVHTTVSWWDQYWFHFDIHQDVLTLLRFAFFLMLALDSFEQIHKCARYGWGFNVTQFGPRWDALLPGWLLVPQQSVLIGCFLVAYFASVRLACAAGVIHENTNFFESCFGAGGHLERLIIVLCWAYTYFISQINNYQHHYMLVLVTIVFCCMDPRSTHKIGNSFVASWQLRLLLVEVAIVYFWTAIAKLDDRWFEGVMLKRVLGPEVVSFTDDFGAQLGIPNSVLWPIVSSSVIVVEVILCFAFLTAKGMEKSGATYDLWKIFIYFIGVAMHVMMGSSGLRIGRFSYFMVILYIAMLPKSFVPTIVTLNNFARKIGNYLDLYSSEPVPQSTSAVDVVTMATSLALGWFIVQHVPLENIGYIYSTTAFLVVSGELFQFMSSTQKAKKSNGIKGRALLHLLSCAALLALSFYTVELRTYYGERASVHLSRGDKASALANFQKTIMVDPSYAEGYTSVGLFFEGTNATAALEHYRKVLNDLDPNDLKAHVGVMRVMHQQSDKNKVCEAYRKVKPLADAVLKINCINEDCSFNQRHAQYAANLANQLKLKWGC